MTPFRGHIQWAAVDTPTPKLIEDRSGPLTIWWHVGTFDDPLLAPLPSMSSRASIGVDVAEGVKADYTEIQVLLHGPPVTLAAQYRSNTVKPSEAGVITYQIGALFGWPLIGVERNGPGLATLTILERGMPGYSQMSGYPNLYYHVHRDRKTLEIANRVGWPTNRTSKQGMLARFSELIAKEAVHIRSTPLLLQMQGFTWDPNSRKWDESYEDPLSRLKNDDGIMAFAIANEMRLAQPEGPAGKMLEIEEW
jgi:hypothetical protein